ncbi:uncharacterized protein LOC126827555 [Patella vulgata]|uniref:uncharacterized protein LOC126827555 n=1 Tax=Patella vulgata TaxID=6465 RepID=UPI0024A887B5|nr:uncharacterized protein LOC126827555 [Patella vulgata]
MASDNGAGGYYSVSVQLREKGQDLSSGVQSKTKVDPVSSETDLTRSPLSPVPALSDTDSDGPNDLDSPLTTPKQKRNELSLKMKVALIQSAKGGKSHRNLAKVFNISKTQVGSILRRKTEILDGYKNLIICDDSRKRLPLSKFGDDPKHKLDAILTQWIEHAIIEKVPVSGPIIRRKALQYAGRIGYKDFKASNGWLDCFRKRHNIVFSKALRGDKVKINRETDIDNCIAWDQIIQSCERTSVIEDEDEESTTETPPSKRFKSSDSSSSDVVKSEGEELQSSSEKDIETGQGLMQYMKSCDRETSKKLEEKIRTDLLEAEKSLQNLITLGKDTDSRLDQVVNQRIEKSLLLQQKKQELDKLEKEIKTLEVQEQKITSQNNEIKEKLTLVEGKVRNCGRALDDLQGIQSLDNVNFNEET